MKSYDELKAEMEAIQQQMVEAKKNERANALKEVKRMCKEFDFTAGMLKGSLAERRKTKLMQKLKASKNTSLIRFFSVQTLPVNKLLHNGRILKIH